MSAEIPVALDDREIQSRLEGREARARKLAEIPNIGFKSTETAANTTAEWAIERILDIGLPVDNLLELTLEKNRRGSETNLGSWGIGEENRGRFTVYELIERVSPEKQLGTIAHESAHANSPFHSENDFVFGSAEARKAASEFARATAEQTIDSQRFINPYHEWLHSQLLIGKITKERFEEETWAITLELSMTNRKHLEQVQAAQHASIDSRIRSGELSSVKAKVNLVSGRDDEGNFVLSGIDSALIALIDDAKDYEGLMKHIEGLKAKFYPEDTLAQVIKRLSNPIKK